MGGTGGGHEGGGAHGDEPSGAGGGAGGAQDEVGACGDAGDAAGQVGADPALVLPGADGDEQRRRRVGPIFPFLDGGGGPAGGAGEQATQGQALGEGCAQGGDLVGGGSTGQEAEGGRGGHPMIVPRPGPNGDGQTAGRQVPGRCGACGAARLG